MFGCLRRLGCLVVLLVGALLYVSRNSWLPLLDRASGRDREAESAAAPASGSAAPGPAWQPLDQPSAERGERAVRALAARRGPAYVTLRPADVASYAFLSLSDALPAALRDAETTVIGDRVYVRAVVGPDDLPGVGSALRGLITRRDTLRLGGTFDVLRPGLAQFRVRDVQVGRVPVPAALIPGLIGRVRRGEVPDGVAADAFPVPVPDYIGDVRIGRGRVTLYKATP
jgi:hypothetical protein